MLNIFLYREIYMTNKKLKQRLVLKKSIKKLITKTLVLIIIFLTGMIIVKQNPETKALIQKNIYEKSFKFTKIKNLYTKYFGDVFNLNNIFHETKPVFDEKITYTAMSKYKDGVALSVTEDYMIPALESGIVVYIGEKADYGHTMIIEQTNGIDVFYSNITTDGINLYDYIEKGSYIGKVASGKLYLIFQKNGKVLNYKDYL